MEGHDPPLTPEVLPEHAAWLRRLAGELVRDPGAAEDVAQETWLAFLRRRPSMGRPLRPWLAQVVRNQAALWARGAAGRRAREAEVARPEQVPSSDELAGRAQVQRRLVDAVLGLEEPYRSAVLLRCYEGLEPIEIAVLQRILGATVRTHLFQGLARLRERLDALHEGDRAAWAGLLMPLLAPTSQGVATGAAGAVGVAIVMATVEGIDARDGEHLLLADAPAALAEAVLTRAVERPSSFGASAEGGADAPRGNQLPASSTMDLEGRFRLEYTSLAPAKLALRHPGYSELRFEAGDGHEDADRARELQLRPTARLVVRVVDGGEEPVRVRLSTPGFHLRAHDEASMDLGGDAQWRTTCAAGDRCTFADLPAREPLSAIVSQGSRSRRVGAALVLQPGETREVTWSLGGGILAGRLLLPDRAPAAPTAPSARSPPARYASESPRASCESSRCGPDARRDSASRAGPSPPPWRRSKPCKRSRESNRLRIKDSTARRRLRSRWRG